MRAASAHRRHTARTLGFFRRMMVAIANAKPPSSGLHGSIRRHAGRLLWVAQSSSTGPRGGSRREEGCRVAHAPSGQPAQLQHPASRVGPGLELALCKHLLDEHDGRAVVARPVVMVCRCLLHRCCALLAFAAALAWSAGKARAATAGHQLLHPRCPAGTSGSLQGQRRSSAGAPCCWAALLR